MKRKTFIIPIGCGASGKSYYYLNNLLADPNYQVINRISADEIRFTILKFSETGIDFDYEIEPEVMETVWRNTIFYLRENTSNLYLDSTNLTKTKRSPFIHVARAFGYKIEMILFDIPLNTILKQNKKRNRTLNEEIILKQYHSKELPKQWEYDKLIIVGKTR